MLSPPATVSVYHGLALTRAGLRVIAHNVDRLGKAWRWLASRRPRTYLIAGWVAFVLFCYPGYLSFDSSMQLFAVRTGTYTDYAPVMTGIWSLLEWVAAGPFPMLVLQSGLFLFGLHGILRHLLSPRAAAVTAAGILLFPPVFSPMAVIWPESLMAGALLAAVACLLSPSRRAKIAGGVLLAIACACRPEIALAIAPLVFLGIPAMVRWQRVAVALGIVVALALVARVGDLALTDDDHHRWQQDLLLVDLAATLHRTHVKDASALHGLTVVDPAAVTRGREPFDSWPLVTGPHRLVDPITSDDARDAVIADWQHVVAAHPNAYLFHRLNMFKHLLGDMPGWMPVYDEFGDPALLAPLHHRALPSDLQDAWNGVVHLFARTPLFKPWLYLLLAIVALVLARRQRLLRNLAISGLVFELAMFFLAPGAEYRNSHWLVTTTTLALVAFAVARKPEWRAPAA